MKAIDVPKYLTQALAVFPPGTLMTITVPEKPLGMETHSHKVFIEGGATENPANALDLLASTQACLDRAVGAALDALAADTNLTRAQLDEHFQRLVDQKAQQTAHDHETTATVQSKPKLLQPNKKLVNAAGLRIARN